MEAEENQAIDLESELDVRINFAMQQNDVPVVKTLGIVNRTDTAISGVELSISTEPGFAEAVTRRFSVIAGQAKYNVDGVDIQLSAAYLSRLTERLKGAVRIRVAKDNVCLAEKVVAVDLLAWNEWGGLSTLPEILAAFVTPNHPALEEFLRSSSAMMQDWTGDPALDGYQSRNRQRVYTFAAAVYAALQRAEITYTNPPASFEDEGQRVRLADQITRFRMATCLDLALLTASCLEQIGLNPLVLVVRGHAITGVWLQQECFATAAIDDGLRVRKRIELGEIAVFDPTCSTAHTPLSFDRAVAEAGRRLSSVDDFLWAIDITRARKGRIRPLPAAVERESAPKTEEGDLGARDVVQQSAPDLSHLPLVLDEDDKPEAATQESPTSRLDRWKRKLLDLSLRNRLLNFRETKKTLKLLVPDISRLEDALAGGTTLQVLPRPQELGDGDPRDAEVHARRTGQDGLAEILREELKARRVYSDVTKEELDRRMTEIYRAARLGLEEGGASALYLAVGFLRWYESKHSDQAHLAPLLLLPLELQRQSVRQGFSLKLSDDEARINVTLLELLKQDFGLTVAGLDPLPADESGLDVPLILQTMRRPVRDLDRWEIVEDTRIGLFSFTKFLMWRDLSERADALTRNSVVNHLVNHPHEPYDPGSTFPNEDTLDDDRSPAETYCPLPADGSQLAAVFAAAEGKSFVLVGPPGTGKSQTITNVIAHCLATGKTVLFVSEKMAALNVVYRRLSLIGLAPFCLELHSNKAQKVQVVAQLESALMFGRQRATEGWEIQAKRLSDLRADLNAVARSLHKTRASGETVFEVTSRLIAMREVPKVDLRWISLDSVDARGLAELRDLVDRLAVAAEQVGSLQGHLLRAVRKKDWSPSWEDQAQRNIGELKLATSSLEKSLATFAGSLGFPDSGWSLSQLKLIREVAVHLANAPAPPANIVLKPDWEDIELQISSWIEHGRARDALRTQVAGKFHTSIVTLDFDDLRSRYHRAAASWWPMSWFRLRPVLKQLKLHVLDGDVQIKAELPGVLDYGQAFQKEQLQLDSASEKARELLGHYWNGGEADWDSVGKLSDWTRELRQLARLAADSDQEKAQKLRAVWYDLTKEPELTGAGSNSLARCVHAYCTALDQFEITVRQVIGLLDVDTALTWGDDESSNVLDSVESAAAGWEGTVKQWRNWCAWQRVRSEAMSKNLQPLVVALESGVLSANLLTKVFDRSYSQWWLNSVLDEETVLREFTSAEHHRKIEHFRETDQRYVELTAGLIQAQLAARIPSAGNDLPNSEAGILRREIRKRRRHLPIRQLLQRIPNLLPRLKPCLLMSPMSVAQYLDAQYPPFDIVVFDEASQIPVWDAVGAIARGKQVVIVGDPKQLPPTSFFRRSDDQDEFDDDSDLAEDMESVLDECQSANIPELPLKWHYRSRHESLITFSNYHYYGNRLLTFPSPDLDNLGVSWRHVSGGAYDKAKSRTNRAEAEAVVQEITKRLVDPNLSTFSIGVVTFSQAQQTLIEDLLDAARVQNPELDRFFDDNTLEPVFVKNLENVQGDERDVILFSICYGPDVSGRVSMNFGPLNKDGGERRLNVSITRARREVIVFSTLCADQIDLARTKSMGVTHLKKFLEYAERGPRAIAEATQLHVDAVAESPFEEAVYESLVQKGWAVHKQVGCASYRIDLAVIDPERSGRYILGIECDGANYHRAKTARDRDKLREAVLRGLGWNLYRIWSTDWWNDPEREVEKLLEAIEEAVRVSKTAENHQVGVNGHRRNEPAEPGSLDATPEEVVSRTEPEPDSDLMKYKATPAQVQFRPSDAFYEDSSRQQIREKIALVVGWEGPISFSLMSHRVAGFWGLERVGSRISARIREIAVSSTRVKLLKEDGREFLWPANLDPSEYREFRIPCNDGTCDRALADISLVEIGNAAEHLLNRYVSVPLDDLVREVARLFGIGRAGNHVDGRIRKAIDRLIKRGRVKRDGAFVVVCKSDRDG